MKIAYVYDNIYPYNIGGVEKRLWELAKRLAQKGHEVTLFGMKHWEGKAIVYSEGVRLWGVCPPQELFVNGRRSIKQATYFAWKVLPPLLRERFDIIDCQSSPYFPAFSAKLASLMKRVPLVITWHEVWGNYWFDYLGKKGIFGKAIERMTIHLADKLIAVSQATKRDLERMSIGKEIKVIPNGVDSKEIREIAPSSQNSDIIFAGRLIREKNVNLLMKAISAIKKEKPDISCIIIGAGPERASVEESIQKLGLEQNVCLKGFLEDHNHVFSYMKSSKAFVLPSTREGFGIAVLEANACGLPVITVRHPQNAACDLIIEGETGFTCNFSEQDIAEKVLMAINEKNISQDKCEEFSKKFDWSRISKLVEEAYKAR